MKCLGWYCVERLLPLETVTVVGHGLNCRMQAIERLLRCTEGGAIVEGRWCEEQVKFKEVGRVMDSGGEMDEHSGSVTCPLTQHTGIIAVCPARSVMLVFINNNTT